MKSSATAGLAQTPKGNSLTRNSKIFKTIISAIQEKKGENIISLDMKNINESIADFFIICEASNHIQLKAIADNIEEMVRIECNEKPYHTDTVKGQKWQIIDYVNIVVHCFLPEQRNFYNLEELWSDANKKEHK